MSTILTTCPCCKLRVGLEPPQVLLLADADTPGSYLFICPACAGLASKPAGGPEVMLLVAAGVAGTAGPPVPAVQADPPLSADDLLDLHELLEAEDWDDRLLGPSA
jgi:hypothetical protein